MKARTDYVSVQSFNYRVSKRTFSFDYKLRVNGKLVREDHYNGSHMRSPATIKKYLERGMATEIILESVIDIDGGTE